MRDEERSSLELVLERTLSAQLNDRPRSVNSRKFRQDERAKAEPVVAQAASATHTIACDIDLSGGKSVASDNRKLASAFIPSGNTRLQNIGV